MATHSSIFAWKIPWTEEPSRLQLTGSQTVGWQSTHACIRMLKEVKEKFTGRQDQFQKKCFLSVNIDKTQFSTAQLLSRVRFFATPRTAARQASLSITKSLSFLKLMSTESVMPSKHLILYRPLFLLPSIFPSIRVFSNGSVLRIRWPKY